jgi:hypothetical protein
MAATQGVAEHNVDPQRRMAVEQLAGVAQMHTAAVTGIDSYSATGVEVVGRATWITLTLDAWKPYFDALARAIAGSEETSNTESAVEATPGDPMQAMMANISKMIAPSMLGMSDDGGPDRTSRVSLPQMM